jgi:MATE family multidrug resistance protein
MNLTLPSQYDFVPRYFRLALANVLSNIMLPLANLVSIIFLGHLEELQHLAGVAIAGNVLNFLYMVLIFLRMGTTGVTAQAVGRNDRDGVILVALRNGLIAVALGIAVILLQYPLGQLGFGFLDIPPEVKDSALSYFHAQIWGAPAIFMNFVLIGWFLGREQNSIVILFSFIGNGTKIALDYLLIVRLGWESAGAGTSYASSQYLALSIGLFFFFRQVKLEEITKVWGRVWDLAAFKSTVTLNSNIFISNLFTLLPFALFNFQGASMGTVIYSQNALLLQIFALSYYFTEGLGFGTETLAGNFTGKGDSEQLKSLLFVSVGTSIVAGSVFAGVPNLFPQSVFGLMTNHDEVIKQIASYAPWLIMLLGFGSIGCMLEGYFLGLAKGNTLRNASLVGMVVAFAPIDFAALRLDSNHILWLSVCSFLTVRMLVLAIQIPATFTEVYISGHGGEAALLEEAINSPVSIDNQSITQMVVEKVEVSQTE